MKGEPNTTIVVPCYNEGRRLPVGKFRGFLEREPEIAFLFVDDGSIDDTAARLLEIARSYPDGVDVLTLPRNEGKAAAVRAGMTAAFARGSRLAGYWDADLATPLTEIPRFVRILDEDRECIVVLGARVRLLGRTISRRAVRHYGGRVFAAMASLALGLNVYDTQCGAKLFRVVDETKALFDKPFATNWTFDVELLARLVAARRVSGKPDVEKGLCEVPLLAWNDVGGSAVRPWDFMLAARDLFHIYRKYRPRG